MATKKTEPSRPVLRRKPKRRKSAKPKRNPWTRADGEIYARGLEARRCPRLDARPEFCPATRRPKGGRVRAHISLTEAIDTTTAQGVLVFHMFSALAEFERALIRERTRAGLKAAKRMGRTGGRPGKLTEDDLDVARTLLANPDITVADIADRIGVSPATLYRYLPAARNVNSPSP